jgi:hypothetical protein
MADVEFYFIGIGEGKLTSFSGTKKQISYVKALECCLEHEGESLTWDFFDDRNVKKTLFQSILRDRKMRVNIKIPMDYRPPFCVVTAVDNRAVRLEYYEGRAVLKLRHDIRSKELEGANLPPFMKEDPQDKRSPADRSMPLERG